MKIQDENIKKILTKINTKVILRSTHGLIEKTRNGLANIGANTKMNHTEFPEVNKFGYAAAIIMAREYQKRVNSLESAWKFVKTTKPETYNLSIKTSTAEVKKSQK